MEEKAKKSGEEDQLDEDTMAMLASMSFDLDLRSDQTFSATIGLTMPGQETMLGQDTMTGTWKKSGTSVEMTLPDETEKMVFELKSGKLHAKINADDPPFVLKRKKS